MAEAPDPDNYIDYDIDHPDDDDDQEVNRTQPFQPGASSTPYHGGEQHEMQTMSHEQEGLPDTSYVETPLLRRAGSISDLQNESALRTKMKKAVDMIKKNFQMRTLKLLKFEEAPIKMRGKLLP